MGRANGIFPMCPHHVSTAGTSDHRASWLTTRSHRKHRASGLDFTMLDVMCAGVSAGRLFHFDVSEATGQQSERGARGGKRLILCFEVRQYTTCRKYCGPWLHAKGMQRQPAMAHQNLQPSSSWQMAVPLCSPLFQ